MIDSWANDAFPLSDWADDTDPSVDVARLIADKTTRITVVRAGVAQSVTQNVRIEDFRNREGTQTEAGITGKTDALVIGYKGHPTIKDTDLQRGDQFYVDGKMFEVVIVIPGLVDQLQAHAMVRS